MAILQKAFKKIKCVLKYLIVINIFVFTGIFCSEQERFWMFHVTHLSSFSHYTVDESDFKFSSNYMLLGLSIESNQYETSNDKYSDILNNKMGKKLGSYKEKYVNCVWEKFLALSPRTLFHCNLFNGSTSTWYIQYYAFYLVPASNEHLLRILILDQFHWT